MTICAIDVGGTGSRVRVITDDGRAAERAGPGLRVASDGPQIDGLFAELGPLVGDAMAAVRASAVTAAAIGQSGLLMLGSRRSRVHAGLARASGAERTVVASDAFTSLVGAIGLQPGAVVAAGTGCIGLGTDLDRVFHRVDGWGHVLGDEGGGSWVGKTGMQAALKAYDGRGGSAVLRDLLLERFGEPDELTSLLYSAPDRAGLLASFAPDVAKAAREGESVAVSIWAEAGVLLARCAAAALDGVEPRVAFVGGITASRDLFAESLQQELHRLRPDANIEHPAGTSLDGATTLARALAVSDGDDPAAGRLPPDYAPFVTTFRK